MKKFLATVAAALVMAVALSSCGTGSGTSGADTSPAVQPDSFKAADLDASYDEDTDTVITLSGSTGSSSSGDTSVGFSLGVATVRAPGTYIVRGEMNGRLIVSVSKEEKVHLVLDGVKITSPDGPAISVISADKATVTLAEGSQNTLTDAQKSSDEDANGCLYSADDLSINGAGSLKITANYNNGISCRNDLKIAGGKIVIAAVNNAIKGKQSVEIAGGDITVDRCDDGIKASDEETAGKGYVTIYGGKINLNCTDDGIQAPVSVTVSGGDVRLNAGGKKINCDGEVNIADGTVR